MNPNTAALQRLYESTQRYYSVPDFNTFVKDLQDDNNLNRLRESLSQYYSMPDLNTMKSDLFDLTEKPQEEVIVEEEVVEAPPGIDFDLAKKLATEIRNKTEGEEGGLLTEEQLNQPIGSVDIFEARKPQEQVMTVDDGVLIDNETLNRYETVEESPLLKAEVEAQQETFDEKGGQYSLDNIGVFVSPENKAIYDNAVSDIQTIYRDVENLVDNVDVQEELIRNVMLNEKEEARIRREKKSPLLQTELIADIPDKKESPEDEFDRLISGEMPMEFDPKKWAIIEEWNKNGLLSPETLNNFDEGVKNAVTNKIKRKKLNSYYHSNDDLDETGRKYVSALLAEQDPGSISYSDVLKASDDPDYLGILKFQEGEKSKAIIQEMKSIKEAEEKPFGDNEELNKDYFSTLEDIKLASDRVQKFVKSGINKNSPASEIQAYNTALKQYQDLAKKYDDRGYGVIIEEQQKRVVNWNKEREKLMDTATELNNVGLALELGTKNYSHLDKAGLTLTKAVYDIVGGTIMSTAGLIGEGLEEVGGSVGMYEMSQFLKDIGGVYVNSEKTFRNYKEESFAPSVDFGSEAGWGEWAASSFADGIPSIATVFALIYGPGKFAKLTGASKSAQAAAVARGSRLAQGAFFGMSYSQKAVDIALRQQEAPEQIAKLRESLEAVDENGNPLLSAFEKKQALSEIEQLENILDWNVMQKAGSSLLAGTIEMYAERLGTLGYMKNFQRIAAPVGSSLFKKTMYQGLNTTINVGTELLEETATQIGNNLVDIHLLGEDKSLSEGLDANFFSNVALTSLAIQGPQVGQNLYNMVQSEVLTKADVKRNERLFNRLLEVESALQNPINPLTGENLDLKQIQSLRAEKKAILESSAMGSVINTQRFAQMSLQDKKAVFDLNRQRRKLLKQLNELGGRGDAGNKSVQAQKNRIVKEFRNIDNQRNQLLSKKQREIQEQMKDAADPALAAYNKGLKDFYADVVQVQQELNGNKYIRVNNETTVDQLVEQGLNKEDANAVIQARQENANATFVNNDIIVFDDNIDNNLMQSVDKLGAKFAAVSPIHELMHIQNRNAGVVKDGKLVSEVNQAVTEAEIQLKQKLDLGQISQEDYDSFIKRKKVYTTDQGVDMEEVLNIFGDLTAAGVLSRYDFSKIAGLKYAIKNTLNKFNNKNFSFLLPIKTANDVYSYVDSFQQSVENQKLKANVVPEEEETDLKLSQGASQAVQDLYNEQGEAAAFDIIEQFKPIVNKIVQRRSEAPGFDRQLLTDEIETGERGILDLIRDYDPDSGVPLAAYINKFLPARAIEASKRVLGEQFDEDVDEQVGLAAPDVDDDKPVEQPKRAIKLKSRLTGNIKDAVNKIRSEVDNLPIADLDFKSLKNIALEEVQKLFGIKPKPGNLTKQDVRNAQQFINNNAEALITMLPEGSTPGGTSTGVQKVLLDNFYTKQDRAKMSQTGSKAGLSVFQKNKNITPSQFKEVFGITPAGQPNISDRNTSARIKALVSQTERMLTNQEVREALQEKDLPVPSKLSEGKAELMFSEGVKLTKAQQRAIDKQKALLQADTGTQLLAEQKNWNQILKNYGIEPVNMKSFEGREAYRLWLANKLAPLVPKEFFTVNSAGTFTGKTDSVRDIDGNRTGERTYAGNFAFLNAKDVAAFLDRIVQDGVSFAKNKIPGLKRMSYSRLNKRFNTEEFKNQQKEKEEGFKQVLRILNDLIQEDISNAPFVAALLSSTSAYQGHMMRTFSPIAFTNFTNLKPVEEHTEPASDLGKFLFNRMLQGNLELYIDGALSNYFQGLLPEVNDLMLKGVDKDGKPFNYTQNAPEEYAYDILLGLKSIWIRYFNPQVNSQVRVDENGRTHTGVDPNILIETNGKSVAENFGIGVEFAQATESVIAKQQELLFEILDNQITQEVARERLDEFLKLSKGLKQSKGINVSELQTTGVLNVNDNMTSDDVLSKAATIDEALRLARKLDMPVKKIRVFDFDDTLAQSNSLVFYTMADGTQGELTAEEFAEQGAQLVEQGAVMDFSDFDIVRDGKRGPLFNVAKKIKDARGNEDLFVLTARSPLAQDAIYEFLKSEGLEFKKENIIGLGNSTGEAKANWIIGKAAEGYNDFYFADDAFQNVKAVRDALEVIDVKSKVQQAKLKFSKGLNEQFDDIINAKASNQLRGDLSEARAKVIGASKGSFKFWIPYSAEDFVGLLYPTLAKGQMGDIQMAWYKRHLLNPFAAGQENLSRDRLQMMNDFRTLKKNLDVPKELTKENETGFTNEQAIRAYLYNKMGYNIPGLNEKDIQDLVGIINNNPQFKVFADELVKITKGDGWVKPNNDWLAGTITTDILELLNTTKRQKYLAVYQANADKIFSEQNLNKLEALYGSRYREALENILQRMKTGRNRTVNNNRLGNKILNYINGANATIMFLNTRSAVLQTISAINYVNWSFNNPLKASQAFSNQPQYWKDFMTLINSDYLKDRRGGLRINVTESEISDAAKTAKNKAKGAIAYIMEKGYLPTQFADSFAIAAGGATFYRNRIKDLVKNEGMTEKQAADQALLEWREISEESQQSSRPDKISQQQSSDVGRLILMFANTPMQYARIQKKAAQDLISGRGDWKNNISKILYYGFVQNLLFNALQQAMFAVGFGDDDEEKDEKKINNTINGMMDSILRGLGIGGAAVSVVKNLLLDLYERSKRSRPEYVDSVWKLTQFSPPISSKISRVRQAAWQFDSKKRRKEIFDKGFSIDNPAFLAFAKVLSATTNIPLDRAILKYENLEGAFQEDNEWWQSMAMLLGWPEWQVKQKNREVINSKRAPSTRRSKSRKNKSKR